jgi:hypothetical protein
MESVRAYKHIGVVIGARTRGGECAVVVIRTNADHNYKGIAIETHM